MNIKTAITLISAVSLLVAGTVFAQTTVQSNSNAEVNAGGLGKGLNSMVKGILGDTESSQAKYSAPPAEPSLMMQMSATLDAQTAPAPEARMMTFKASNAEEMIVAMSDAELSTYVHDLLLQDSNLQSIDTSDTHVRITYAVPSKVFRVVKVVMRVTVSAQASGKTDVTYPWYAFAASGAASDLRKDVSERVAPLIPQHPFTPDEQRMLIDEIHLTLAARLGSSTGGDR